MGISVWQLLIILAIVLVLFGAKRLRNIGEDLGGAIKDFRKAMKEDESPAAGEGKLEGVTMSLKARSPRKNRTRSEFES